MHRCPLRGISIAKSYLYAFLQIGWDEGGFFSVASHALPTVIVILATERTSSLVMALPCSAVVMVQLWQSPYVLGTFQPAKKGCFLSKGSHTPQV